MMVEIDNVTLDARGVMSTLKRLFPNTSLSDLEIHRTMITSLIRAEFGGNELVMSADGKYVLFGESPQISRTFAREEDLMSIT